MLAELRRENHSCGRMQADRMSRVVNLSGDGRFPPVLVGLPPQSRLMLEGRTRTLRGPSPDVSPPRVIAPAPEGRHPVSGGVVSYRSAHRADVPSLVRVYRNVIASTHSIRTVSTQEAHSLHRKRTLTGRTRLAIKARTRSAGLTVDATS